MWVLKHTRMYTYEPAPNSRTITYHYIYVESTDFSSLFLSPKFTCLLPFSVPQWAEKYLLDMSDNRYLEISESDLGIWTQEEIRALNLKAESAYS